jgi:hypothetical protein
MDASDTTQPLVIVLKEMTQANEEKLQKALGSQAQVNHDEAWGTLVELAPDAAEPVVKEIIHTHGGVVAETYR